MILNYIFSCLYFLAVRRKRRAPMKWGVFMSVANKTRKGLNILYFIYLLYIIYYMYQNDTND